MNKYRERKELFNANTLLSDIFDERFWEEGKRRRWIYLSKLNIEGWTIKTVLDEWKKILEERFIKENIPYKSCPQNRFIEEKNNFSFQICELCCSVSNEDFRMIASCTNVERSEEILREGIKKWENFLREEVQ